jgi:predicted outer membrane repeat protein
VDGAGHSPALDSGDDAVSSLLSAHPDVARARLALREAQSRRLGADAVLAWQLAGELGLTAAQQPVDDGFTSGISENQRYNLDLSVGRVFAPGTQVSLSLSQGVMTISDTITITGDVDSDGAADITIDGNAAQIFTVQSGGALSLNALTVTDGGGGYGGAIRVQSGGVLDVTASTFTGNHAGSEGGAIYNEGTATIANSTFSGNSAVNGGRSLPKAP